MGRALSSFLELQKRADFLVLPGPYQDSPPGCGFGNQWDIKYSHLCRVVVRGSHQAEGGRPGQCPRNLRRALEVSVSFGRAGRIGIGRLGIRGGETPWWAVRGGVVVVGQLAGRRGAERSCRDVGGEGGR